MNIVGVIGSRRKGNTYAMVKSALEEVKSENIEIIHLNKDFRFCDGCLNCDETSKCKYSDWISEKLEVIRNADLLIIGTPSRWSLMSGELKTFIDRLNPLAMNEELSGKKAIIFAVGQCEGETEIFVKNAAKSVEMFLDNSGIELVDTVIATGCLEKDDLIKNKVNFLEECKRVVKKFI